MTRDSRGLISRRPISTTFSGESRGISEAHLRRCPGPMEDDSAATFAAPGAGGSKPPRIEP